MFQSRLKWIVSLLILFTWVPLSRGAPADDKTGFLVLAPDRGFLGNQEVRDVFDEFKREMPTSALAFATAEKCSENMQEPLARLDSRQDLLRIAVLPLFLSSHNFLYQEARKALDSLNHSPLEFASPVGASYLAEEILFDRVEELSRKPDEERLILVAAGARLEEETEGIVNDLQPLLNRTLKKYHLKGGGEIVVLYDWSAEENLRRVGFLKAVDRVKDSSRRFARTLVIPFNFGRKLTTMMSQWNRLRSEIEAFRGVAFAGRGILPHENVLDWLRQESTRFLPLGREEVGMILVPHGSDFNWNQTMRRAFQPLGNEYTIEEAFSMVDPVVVAHAVRRLEQRGVKAALMVRIFSLEASFREKAEYILGLRRDYPGFPRRIRSRLLFHTVGGVEASPHLARAMLDRIAGISRDPEKETVILLAHGTGDESRNDHWENNLKILSEYIRRNSGRRFRAVRYATWREDWPQKRKRAVRKIRAMIVEASKEGGVALLVPDRTAGRGHGDEYLQGLNYRYATGFAPHPEFTRWLRDTIEGGLSFFTGEKTEERN